MKKTNFKCMYLVDDFLYNKVVKDNPNDSTVQNTFKDNPNNLTVQNTFKKKIETSGYYKPSLNNFSNTTDTVSTPSLGLNRETEPTILPSLPTSHTPDKSTLEPILTSDCDCSEPNKSSAIINKRTPARKRRAKEQLTNLITKKKNKQEYICLICDNIFKSESQLLRHDRYVHKEAKKNKNKENIKMKKINAKPQYQTYT